MFLTFDHISNARDLGGLPAAGGRHVKPGLLLRTAKLSGASEADLSRLSFVRHIVDFRDEYERAAHPDKPLPGAEYHALSALPGLPPEELPDPARDPDPDFRSMFREIYRLLAEGEDAERAYRAFFEVLLRRDGAVLFHCTQGKDRTGVAALLALAALGADEQTALDDYYLTSEGLRDDLNRAVAATPPEQRWRMDTAERLFFVFPDHLEAWQEPIARAYGSTLGYIRTRLGVTDAQLAALREFYLE